MRLRDYITIAIHQIKKNRLRTVLTIIGIMIGVASMITVISVSNGGQRMINNELLKFGINRIWLFPNDVRGPNKMLVMSDAEMLKEINGIKDVAPSAYQKAFLSNQKVQLQSDVVGTTEALFNMEQMTYLEGRGLTESDIGYTRRVVVLSEQAKDKLFGDKSAEGQKVSINGQKFTVIGVEKEDQTIYSSFFSGKCYIPITTFISMFSSKYVDEISVTASGSDTLDYVIKTSVSVLLNKYGEGSLKIINLTKEIANAQKILDIFTVVVSAVAGVALLVGGIGIMNIMLVTIKERTREIGIRKALGAGEHHILGQFLAEALFFALLGCLLGIAIGVILTKISGNVIGIQAEVSGSAATLSVLFSATIGILFGLIPAYKASKLDPVEALRHE
ncbi:MAG: ABC transporter permease [Christensenellales bacterium]|jgi:putative ABC transport system permease protein